MHLHYAIAFASTVYCSSMVDLRCVEGEGGGSDNGLTVDEVADFRYVEGEGGGCDGGLTMKVAINFEVEVVVMIVASRWRWQQRF